MKYFGNGLSQLHKDLNAVIRKADRLDEAKELFLMLHGKLNVSLISDTEQNEVDVLLGDLEPYEYRIMPTSKDETIAWVLWHIARIEDLTMNILVAGCEQVFDDEWKKHLNVSVSDTGNAMSDDDIMELSQEVNIEKLISYRNTVAKRTRSIVRSLSAEDMRRKVSGQGLETIRQIGGVTDQEDSLWLLDFWR